MLKSNVTYEGGFIPGASWVKYADQITLIYANSPSFSPDFVYNSRHAPLVKAMGISNFKLKDISFEHGAILPLLPNQSGTTNYGIILNQASSYLLSRLRIDVTLGGYIIQT